MSTVVDSNVEVLRLIRTMHDSALADIAIKLAAEDKRLFLRLAGVELPYWAIKFTGYGNTEIFNLTSDNVWELLHVASSDQRSKIPTIKVFRSFTNAGLSVAKHIVEWLAYNGKISANALGDTHSHEILNTIKLETNE